MDKYLNLGFDKEFKEVFLMFIQLGAIMAVIVHYFSLLFSLKKKKRKDTLNLYLKIIVSSIPGLVVMLLFNEIVERHFETPFVIASALIIYGIAFILMENVKEKKMKEEINFKDAFYIGLFQSLAIIPGTSRSGATLLGALTLGIKRDKASEYSFLLALPAILGSSGYKLIKHGIAFSNEELFIMFFSMLGAFLVSLVVIKSLLKYLKTHDFKSFGVYRIILGLLILFFGYLL